MQSKRGIAFGMTALTLNYPVVFGHNHGSIRPVLERNADQMSSVAR